MRSAGIIRRLLENPGIRRVHLSASVGREFVDNQLLGGLPAEIARKLEVRPQSYDRVIVQRDSVTADWEESEKAAERLAEEWEARIAEEAKWLRELSPGIVLSDTAAIPVEAAGRAGLPSFAVGNFTWDWIFETMGGEGSAWRRLAELYRKAYGHALGWFRLPFHPEGQIPPIRNVLPIGLLARPGVSRRFELARATGAAPEKPWVLLAFASLGWDAAARRRAAAENDAEFFAMSPMKWGSRTGKRFHLLAQDAMPFADLVASCDAVVTKPGYGILSDCLANRKPMAYAERPGFREAPVLERGIEEYMAGVKVSYDRFYAGDFAPELAEALAMPWRPRRVMEGGGLERLTDLVWRFLEMPDGWTGDSGGESPPPDWGGDE